VIFEPFLSYPVRRCTGPKRKAKKKKISDSDAENSSSATALSQSPFMDEEKKKEQRAKRFLEDQKEFQKKQMEAALVKPDLMQCDVSIQNSQVSYMSND
jgi:hypothetical protein